MDCSCSLRELLAERRGECGAASGLELAELSLRSAWDRAEGKATNRGLGVLGDRAVCPTVMLLTSGRAPDTNWALGKYLMNGDSENKSPGPAVPAPFQTHLRTPLLAEWAQMCHAVSYLKPINQPPRLNPAASSDHRDF